MENGAMAKKPDFDLDSLDIEGLSALIAEAEAMRQAKMDAAREAFRSETAQRAAALGLALEDLFPSAGKPAATSRKKRSDAGTQGSVKFRGPAGQEWSGRGRPPQWLTAAEAEGKSREQFRVG